MAGTADARSGLWDWLDQEEPAPTEDPIDPALVTAVLVTHNGAEWLERHLPSLARLEPRPGRIIGVDNGSTDDSAQLLAAAAAEGVIDEALTGSADLTFGQAVSLALEGQTAEWVWLLHDDSAPRPDALGQLLLGAAAHNASIVLPKLLQPERRNYPDALAEIGQTITDGGRRVLTVDEGDIDQHQSQPEPVLGGSTAGMLVSGPVWEELGGLAAELPLHHDGLDLGWRANQAGHTVITWPDAAIMHRQSGRMGERGSTFARSGHELDRLTALRLIAARSPDAPGRIRIVLGSLLRSFGFLIAKSPSTAAGELRAMRTFLHTPELTASLAERPAGDADVAALRPGRGWTVRHLIDRAGNAFAERYRELTASETDTSLDELTGDDFAGGRTTRAYPVSPLLSLVAVLFIAGMVAGRSLIGSGTIAGGGLLPAPENLTQAWEAYLRPAVGASGANPPWLAFAAFFATFIFANPGWFAVIGLLIAPLLAALTAYLLLRRLAVPIGMSAGTAAAWAGATLALGIVTAGDVTGLVLAIVTPLFVRSIHRITQDRSTGAERLRSPAVAAVWLIIMCSVWPVLLPMSSIAAIAWALSRRGRVVDAAILVAAPWLFLAPWLLGVWRWPGRMLTGVDPLAWPGYFPAGIAMLVGRIMPSGLPLWGNIVFFVVLGLLSAYALVKLNSVRVRRLIMVCIALPLISGAVISRLVVSVPGGEARTSLSGWALLTVAALLAPIVVLRMQRDDRDGARDLRTTSVALALVGALMAGLWAVTGFAGPVQPTPSLLPSYVRDVIQSPRETRVLMVDASETTHVRWNLVDARQPRWGTGERLPVGAQAAEYSSLVQTFSGVGTSEDLAQRLSQLGISHVWTRGLDADRLAALGDAPGLTRAAADQESVIWTVDGAVSRYQLIEGDQTSFITPTTLDAGEQIRYLVLAESPDGRWRATVGEQELAAAPERPPVTFIIPPGASGELVVELAPAWRWFVIQLGVVAVLLILALPTLGGQVAARRGL